MMVVSLWILLQCPHELKPWIDVSCIFVGRSKNNTIFEQKDIEDNSVIVNRILDAFGYSYVRFQTEYEPLTGTCEGRFKQPLAVSMSSEKWEGRLTGAILGYVI